MKVLMCSDYRIVRVTGFQIKYPNVLATLPIQNIYMYVLYTSNKNPVKCYSIFNVIVSQVTGYIRHRIERQVY
jgi:hypothetical protein